MDESEVPDSFYLPIIASTKIGGFPHFIQGGADETTISGPHGQCFLRKPKAQFLCQLASIQPPIQIEFPWANIRKPLPRERMYAPSSGDPLSVTFGDMGSIYIFIEPNGKCHARLEDY